MTQSKSSWVRLVIFALTLLFVTVATLAMIRYAKGYRPTNSGIKGTGLLSANSFPTAAEVYINGKLTTATDATLNLDPGTYEVTIKKDGYHTWQKNLTIVQELVTSTNTLLFPTSPTLEPLTFTDVVNPIPSPDGSLLAYSVASASAESKNGLYVLELSSSPISLSRSSRQIARSLGSFDYANASYTWAPSGNEILVAFASGAHVILDPNRMSDTSTLLDVTATLPQLLEEWELELTKLERARLQELPDFFIQAASSSATNLYFSPDGEKLLYQAKSDFTVPSNLIPQLPASSTQAESREVTTGNWYVYDLIEDRNFLVAPEQPQDPTSFVTSKLLLPLDASPSATRSLQQSSSAETIALLNAQYSPVAVDGIQWFPDSSHLVVTSDSEISLVDYDGTNRVTVYAGPFDSQFVYAAPDGSRLITLIKFSPDALPNLYTIKLK